MKKMKKIKLTLGDILKSYNGLTYLKKKEVRNIKLNYSLARTFKKVKSIFDFIVEEETKLKKKYNVEFQFGGNIISKDKKPENCDSYKKEWKDFLKTEEELEYYNQIKLSELDKLIKEDKNLKLNFDFMVNLTWLIEE